MRNNKGMYGLRFQMAKINLSAAFFLLALLPLISCGDSSSPDCADPSATNFSSGALGYGDCVFPEEFVGPEFLNFLEFTVEETSGLAIVNGNFITHNDRGHTNELFVFDTETGLVTNTFEVLGAENEDWEDLAQNEDFLFVGDIGNNPGDRQNLRIYMVDLDEFDFQLESGTVPLSGTIKFNYPEQETFVAGNRHNWDCEALIYRDGYLYLFMKHRTDALSNLYRIPASAGNYQAEWLAYFNAGHRITGADISPNGNQIALVGYNKDDNCVVWLLDDFDSGHPLSGTKRMLTLGTFSSLGQMEAIVYKDSSTMYITAESVDGIPPRLYRLELP
jgi:hypothetical protein